ncbi:MAG: hypothetical protein ACRCWR_00085, partial [Saezia sp.]
MPETLPLNLDALTETWNGMADMTDSSSERARIGNDLLTKSGWQGAELDAATRHMQALYAQDKKVNGSEIYTPTLSEFRTLQSEMAGMENLTKEEKLSAIDGLLAKKTDLNRVANEDINFLRRSTLLDEFERTHGEDTGAFMDAAYGVMQAGLSSAASLIPGSAETVNEWGKRWLPDNPENDGAVQFALNTIASALGTGLGTGLAVKTVTRGGGA